MLNELDLKKLEKKAFRATQQDGLWDIYIGGVVLSMSTLAYSDTSEAFPFLQFGLFLGGLGLFFLIFWGGRKYITTPRLGQVKFGPQRQKRKLTLTIILSVIVVAQVILVVGTALLWANPQWAANLGFASNGNNRERLLVAMIGVLFVGPSTALIAYFNEFMRGYYISLILSAAVFALIWFGQPGYLIGSSLLIIIPGVVLFIRFLRKYPLPPAQVRHD